MESHDIVKELLKKIPAKHIASELGVSLSLVYKWAEPPSLGSGASNPLDRTEALVRLSGSHVPLQWLCGRFGGAFATGGAAEGEPRPLPEAFGMLTRQLGNFLAEIGALVEGGRGGEGGERGDGGGGDDMKAAELRVQWEKLKACAEMALCMMDQGQAVPGPTRAEKMRYKPRFNGLVNGGGNAGERAVEIPAGRWR